MVPRCAYILRKVFIWDKERCREEKRKGKKKSLEP